MDFLVTLWDLNVYLFYFINLNFENPLLNFLMPIITVFGSVYLWLIGFSAMFIWGGVKEKNTALLGIITLVVSMTIVVKIYDRRTQTFHCIGQCKFITIR